MDIFVIIENYQHDDPYYGYYKSMHSVHDSFEKAKNQVDLLVADATWANHYRGENGEPYITILQMQMGKTECKYIYNTLTNPNGKPEPNI